MANNKTTYTLEINAELGNLEKKLGSVKQLVSGVIGSANAPKGLEKAFEKVEGLIDRIKAKSSQPIDSKSGFASITKDVDSANIALAGMLKIVESIGSMSESAQISFLPPDAQAQINAIIASLSNYEKVISAATTETVELTSARSELAKAEEKVAAAQAKLEARTGQLEQAKLEKQAAEEAISAIKERKTQLAALRVEQEKIEKFYAAPDAEGKKRNQSKKYDGVSMRPQDIKKKIAELEKASAGDETSIEEWREALKAAKSDIDSYIGQVQTARRELSASEATYDQLVKKVENLENAFKTDSAKNQEKAFKDLRDSAEKLGVSLDGIGDSYSEKDANELIKRLSGLKAKGLQQIPNAAEKASKGIKEIANECHEVRGTVDSATEAFEGLNEAASQQKAFEDRIKSFLGISGAAQVMRAALRDAMQTITELDSTMTEMAVVTDLTVGDYWDQLPEYSKRASDLGVSINSAYKAATLYYQQGLKTNEVNAISAETLKMAKIAGLDAADATNKMTAALRGFNMELNEASAQKVSDVYSELAAITAADVGEISTAMTKTASIASSAGMEFETTAAFLSQIIETTRESAETAGTAMKTVIARFQELKKVPDEIGEVDGEIVDANAIETALRSVGVSLRDASGQFRDLDDVFLELSSKWDGLDKNTQRYIATIAAGSRQQSRFIAMMSDYGRTQELVTSANNSAGASNRQFEKTMDSLEAKMEKLKNAWHEFTMGIMDSDLLKTGIDILTKFLEIINKVTAGLGDSGIGGGLTKIMSVLTVFKVGMKIFEKFKPYLQAFFGSIVEMAGISGEKSGQAYAEGVKKAKESAVSGMRPTNTPEASKVQAAPRLVENKDGKQWGTVSTGLANAGQNALTGLGRATGVTSFTEAIQASREIKSAKATLGKNTKERIVKAQQYQENKKALEEKKGQYTFHKNGTASKKGQKGMLSKEETEKAKKEIDELTKSVEEYEGASEKLSKNSEKQWKSINDGISAASGALMAVGMGFGMLGNAFEEAGMDGAAEAFNKMSQVATTAGAVLGIIPPILTVIQTLFPGVGAASAAAGGVATTAGATASAAWGVVGVIVMIVIAAIVVALAVILLVMAAIKNASPEKKLEDTKKAAEAAADAADQATEAYENLANALDDLDGKYKALEELTEGTKEWNEAVREINSSVLDLIQEYPELAKFVENQGGVLTLDLEGEGVQQVLNQAESRKIVAKNESIMANVAVAKAEDDVAYSNLDTQILTKAFTQEISGALSSGEIYDKEGAKKAIEEYYKETYNLTDTSSYESTFDYYADLIMDNADELKSYGESLSETELQQKASFDAIAMSTQSLANTMDMSADQIRQSQNLVDGEVSETYYKEMMNKLKNEDLAHEAGSEGQYSGEYKEELEAAVKQKYGPEAKIGNDGKVTFRGADGQDQTVTLTSEEMRRMIATQYATEKTTNAIEWSDEAVTKLATGIGKQVGNEKGGAAAVNALYMDDQGGTLTQADLELLESETVDLQAIWNDMTEDERSVFGGDFEKMQKDFSRTVGIARKDFEMAGEAERDFMTADMAKGFKNKLDEVAQLAGGETAKQAVLTATDALLEGRTDYEKQQIQSRINMTDWSNQESLLGLQIALEHQYGFTAEEAEAYVTALGEAAFATSGLTTTVKVFGDLWKATEKVNQSMERLTALQWKYEKAIAGSGDSIEELANSMLDEYALQAEQYSAGYEASNDDLAKIYARGGLDYGVDLRKFVTLGENGVNVDETELQKAIDSKEISEEDATEWLEKLNNQYATSQDQLQGLRDTLDNIEALEQQGRDAYFELRDMAKEAIVASLQEQIDLQQQTLDATRDAGSQLINKIQEQINESRQARDNEGTEKNISDLQSQRAYLAMDTSGTNILQTQQLDEDIANAEQAYQDTLVDQAIQNLTDANEKAAEQRERQIALAQSSLEAYQISNRFQEDIDYSLQEMLAGGTDWESSSLGEVMKEYFTQGMGTAESEGWAKEIGASVGLANVWKTTDWKNEKDLVNGYIDGIETGIAGLSQALTNAAAEKKVEDQKKSLTGAGFDADKINALGEDQLNKLTTFTSNEDAGGTMSTSQKHLSDANVKVKSQGEYYKENMDKILKGEDVDSYEEYLSGQVDTAKTSTKTTALNKAQNRNLGLRGFKDTDDYKTGLDTYKKLGGTESEFNTYLQNQLKNTASGHFPDDSGVTNWKKLNDNWYQATVKINGESAGTVGVPRHATSNFQADSSTDKAIRSFSGNATPENGWVAMYAGEPYIYNGNWHKIVNGHSISSLNSGYSTLKEKMRSYLTTFKTGGIADFTGPAWLDGTPSHPEYILNADQTERFFSLVDVLEGFDSKEKKKTSGDNYFDIEINIEKIEDDYDVEQMANKIRSMIYEDAIYRNVNAVNHIR